MKKRIILALTSFALCLAGCGKDPKDPPKDDDKIVDPSGDEEKLTPEQQRNSDQIYTYVSMGLGLTGQKSKGIENYISSYCDEIAIKDIKSETIQSIALELTNIFTETIDAQKVFDLLCSFKENETLKDASYFAVAFAKSYGRSVAYASEENADMINSLLDKVDLEKQNVHSNLYSTLDVSLDAYYDFTSDEFTGLVNEAYSDENKVVDKVKAKELMVYVSESLDRAANIETNVKYFASLAEKLFKVEPQTRALTSEASGIDEAITMLFDGVRSLSSLLEYYGDVENSDLNVVFDIVNYILKGDWQSALTTGATTLIKIGLSLIGLENEYTSLLLSVGPFIVLPNYLKESFTSDEFTEMINSLKETFTVDGLKDVIGEVVNIVSTLSYLKDSFLYLNGFVGKCIVQIGTMFYDLSEDEAQALVEKFDVSSYIETGFGYYDSLLSMVANLDDSFYDVIQLIIDKNYEEVARQIINEVFTLIGSSTTFESVKEDVDAIGNVITNIFESFVADSFKEKVASIINEETHELDNAKLKEVITDVATILEDILNIKENVTNFGEQLLDVVRQLLLTLGFSEDEINALFEDVDVSSIVELVFEKLEEGINLIKQIGDPESSEYEVYYTAISDIVSSILNKEEPLTTVLVVVTELVNIIFDQLELTIDQFTFSVSVLRVITAPYLIYNHITETEVGEGEKTFKEFLEAVYDKDTKSIDKEALGVLLADVGEYIFAALADLSGSLCTIVDFVEEVVNKVQEMHKKEEPTLPDEVSNPENNEDEENDEGEEPVIEKTIYEQVKEKITLVCGIISTIGETLQTQDETYTQYVDLFSDVFDLVACAINEAKAIIGDESKTYSEIVPDLIHLVLLRLNDLITRLEPVYEVPTEVRDVLFGSYSYILYYGTKVILEFIEKGPSNVDKEALLRLIEEAAITWLPGSQVHSGTCDNLDELDEETKQLLPMEEIEAAVENKIEGEWTLEEPIKGYQCKALGEDKELYDISYCRVSNYEIRNEVYDDESHLVVSIEYYSLHVVIPSLQDVVNYAGAGVFILGYALSQILPYINEASPYVVQLIDLYRAVTGSHDEESPLVKVDEIVEIVEAFVEDDAALTNKLIMDAYIALNVLVSLFANEDGEIEFTPYLVLSVLNSDFVPYDSLSEETIAKFDVVISDAYEVASIIGYKDELLEFLSTYVGEDILVVESSEEFTEYVHAYLIDLIAKPSEASQLGA